jgi:hypothetical protein
MESNNKVTIDDLTGMIKEGFDEMGGRFDKVEGRLDKVEGRLDNLEQSVIKLEKSHAELNELVMGVHRIEMIDLKRRVEVLEKKLGIE